ncbi:MAG: PEP/pyruvate-binding domain-containing protein [Deltaproteobacteria bacterium]|nr:PEP/pyruvate-binding domain-containing protein [Deltaproteobacteria bacterium]
MPENIDMSTGIDGLDRVIGRILPGDNIVWQVDSIEDYAPFIPPYAEKAKRAGRPLIYFRFAKHRPLVPEELATEIHELNPEDGFETFLNQIHRVIERIGRRSYYVFDCLSDLVADWYSDQMLANFFVLTCPYLFDLETLAYFALIRNHHSFRATEPITQTTQLLLDVYRHRDQIFIHPLKAQHRHTPTMYMLHTWANDDVRPVTDSITASEILSSRSRPGLKTKSEGHDAWKRNFTKAAIMNDDLDSESCSLADANAIFERLLRMSVSRDERILELARKYFTLSDLIAIGERMIGTGLIGGKTVGVLLGRAILRKEKPELSQMFEVHDSFFIASDVFYTFLVRNGCWWLRETIRNPDTFLQGAKEARRLTLRGSFPDYLIKEFSDMLDYFGQSPIIVRSSSLLEDNFGHAFVGKYDSVFCANQGSRSQRLEDFLAAVRRVYASAMSDEALRYRAKHGILDRDEQMSLLVQRVSGALYGHNFFPQMAGVGFSFNPYVWDKSINPEAGMLRLVFGLGTRAVDRRDDDYTRLVALNEPERRPEGVIDNPGKYSQRKVDLLDLEANQLVAKDFTDIIQGEDRLPLAKVATRDQKIEEMARQRGRETKHSWVLTFDQLLTRTSFANDMREILSTLHKVYDHPVDIEFTANFLDDDIPRINLVQCRPFQVRGVEDTAEPPASLKPQDIILKTHRAIIGQSRVVEIDRLIYVVPAIYGNLPIAERYDIAALIGRIVHSSSEAGTTMLLGPGRWGSTTPSLGIPVSFSQINRVSILCEIVAMRDDLIPDVSLGTHFFSEIVGMDMLYLAVFPQQEKDAINHDFFCEAPNKLRQILPDASLKHEKAVRIFDAVDLPQKRRLKINANTLKQKALCYFDPE